jgi:hypothetical protein
LRWRPVGGTINRPMVYSRMVAALALLGVVAVASTAQLDGGRALSGSELTIVVVLAAAVVAVVLGMGTLALGAGYAIFAENRRRLLVALLIVALFAAVVALVLMPADATLNGNPLPRRRPPPEAQALNADGSSGRNVAAIAAAVVAGAALLGTVLALVGAKVRADRRQRRMGAAAAVEEEDAVLEAVEESLDDLRRERDVRRAIIACYARMERALDRAGSARRPAEAPFEYLARVLERITANGPAARVLTELFERAKFGTEPMEERDKDRAVGALELLRAEVGQQS